MSDVMSERSVEGAPFVDGPLQAGDSLVAFHEPGLRGVGVDLAEKALVKWYSPYDWREIDLTDDDQRQWTFGQLVVESSASIGWVFDSLKADEDESTPVIHALAEMTEGFVPELKRLLRNTGLGADITRPYSSQLMRMIQYRAGEDGSMTDNHMYETFPMGHGPILAAPNPERVLKTIEKTDHEARIIGSIIGQPTIRIYSEGTERRGQTLRYDV